MSYKYEREKIVNSFNYLMNAIARTNNIGLKKNALKFQDNFEKFIENTVFFDSIMAELDVTQTKATKLELLLSLFLPVHLHETIDEPDIIEMKRLQLDNYYAIKSFIEDSSMVSEMNLYKKMGFRFKKGLNREQLKLKIDDCRKKIANQYASSKKQPE